MALADGRKDSRKQRPEPRLTDGNSRCYRRVQAEASPWGQSTPHTRPRRPAARRRRQLPEARKGGTLPQDGFGEAEGRAPPDSREPRAGGVWFSPPSTVVMYSADGALCRLPALYHIPL